jgi:hypothetical protein
MVGGPIPSRGTRYNIKHMEKFKPNESKKQDATQLDMHFEENKKVEEEQNSSGGKEQQLPKVNNEEDTEPEKDDPGWEYQRYNKIKEEKKKEKPPKKEKTQEEKDEAKIKAIRKALEKNKDKDIKTGYEHPGPWDMSR